MNTTRGLVGQDQRRISRQGPGNGDPLLLAAGKLLWKIPPLFFQSYPFQGFHGPFPPVPGIHARVKEGKLHVLQKVQLWKQIVLLEYEADHGVPDLGQLVVRHIAYVLAVQKVFTLRGNVQGSDDVHQRGFSAAGFSYNGHKLSLFNGKGDPVAGPHLLVPHLVDLIDVLQLDQRDLSCACVFFHGPHSLLMVWGRRPCRLRRQGRLPFRRPCRRVPSSSYPYWCQSQNPDPRRPHLPRKARKGSVHNHH